MTIGHERAVSCQAREAATRSAVLSAAIPKYGLTLIGFSV
jgi:hypothetical protein